MLVITVCVMHPKNMSDLEWRRLQVHEQQSERAKKSPVQKTLIFARRAHEKMSQALGWKLSFSLLEIAVFLSTSKLVNALELAASRKGAYPPLVQTIQCHVVDMHMLSLGRIRTNIKVRRASSKHSWIAWLSTTAMAVLR